MKTGQFLKNNIFLMAGTVLAGFLGYLFHFVISRMLSVGQYGELQAIISLTMIFGVFSSAFSYFVIKNSSVFSGHGDREGQSRFLRFLIHKSKIPLAGIFALYILSLPLLKNLLHLEDYFGLLAVGLSLVFFLLSGFYVNTLQGWKKFLAVGSIGAAAAAVKLASGFVLASLSLTASAVSLSLLVSAVSGWLIARYVYRKNWPEGGSFSLKENGWREKYFNGESFKKSLAGIFLFSLAISLAGNLDIVLVKNLTSSETAGYYGALSVLGKMILWLNLSVIGVMFPEACSVGHLGRPAQLRSVFGSYALIILISIPSLIVYYFFPEFLVGLLFGQKYVVVAGFLWLFGLSALFLSFLNLEANLALARRDKKISYLLGSTVFVLVIGLFFFHSSIKQIVTSVSLSFFLGWLLIFSRNILHRFSFDKAGFEYKKV